jgi:SAM-dependent methyltransferase
MDLFFELHNDLPREGPGDDASTRRAYALLNGLPASARILDLGCGPGMQTLELARLSLGNILAVDNHRPFLAELVRRACAEGLQGLITPLQMSMFDPGFASESFDLLWSEGAIYIIGFENGLQQFRGLLKPGGYLAATELSWIRPDPPQEIHEFWQTDYPGMHTRDENLAAATRQGYGVVDSFILPESAWMEGYYLPLERRITHMRVQYAGDADYQRMLDASQREIDLYRHFSAWYGYVFYILQKTDGMGLES